MAEALEIRPGDTRRAAAVLLEAERSVTARGPITAQWPTLDLPGAYTVQYEALQQRLARGEKLTAAEEAFYRENRDRVRLRRPSDEEAALKERLK